MRIIGYIRYSKIEQGKRMSTALQKHAIEKWARKHQHRRRPIAWYLDATPGTTPLHKRPGLQAALADLEPGDVLAVYRLDRLARDLELQLRLFRAVAAGGARIVSTMDEGTNADEADDPDAAFLRNLQGALAQRERAVLARRIKDGVAAKRRSGGKYCNHAPYGWRWDSHGRLAESQREQRTRRIACELRESGLSLRSIAAELRLRRRFSRSGGVFSRSQVARMLAPKNVSLL